MAEGYKEDVEKLPNSGFDDKRYANSGNSLTLPTGNFPTNVYQGSELNVSNPTIPYEPGENGIQFTTGENDFPRQTGHDSLPDDAVPLT